MLAHTHIVIGIVVGIYLKENLQIVMPESIFLYYFVLTFASVLPDIDHKGSLLNKTITITKIIPWLFKHRGIFHSIWPLVMGSGALYAWTPFIGIAYFIGYASHLLIDSLTKAGVNWLYPSTLKIQGPLHTGGIGETVIFLVFAGFLVIKLVG